MSEHPHERAAHDPFHNQDQGRYCRITVEDDVWTLNYSYGHGADRAAFLNAFEEETAKREAAAISGFKQTDIEIIYKDQQ